MYYNAYNTKKRTKYKKLKQSKKSVGKIKFNTVGLHFKKRNLKLFFYRWSLFSESNWKETHLFSQQLCYSTTSTLSLGIEKLPHWMTFFLYLITKDLLILLVFRKALSSMRVERISPFINCWWSHTSHANHYKIILCLWS